MSPALRNRRVRFFCLERGLVAVGARHFPGSPDLAPLILSAELMPFLTSLKRLGCLACGLLGSLVEGGSLLTARGAVPTRVRSLLLKAVEFIIHSS